MLACIFSVAVRAQTYLNRPVTLPVTNMQIGRVLQTMEAQCGFYFSYNSSLFNADSLVTVPENLKTVLSVLQYLFADRFRYHQSGNHLIILAATTEKYRYVTGVVVDKASGMPVADATVYESNQLVAAMTDEKGAFRIQLKERYFPKKIRVSKLSYVDTQITLGHETNFHIKLERISYDLEPVIISSVEHNWLVKHILSTRQKINAVNLGKFFAMQPFQFSVLPGLGSHGKMSAQVINKFSLNILGGYNAGVNGVEIGGLFNISRTDVSCVQLGGLFNVVGGKMDGVQIGGLYNSTGKNVSGVQVGGLANVNQLDSRALQLGGLFNSNRSFRGMQIAGLTNYTKIYTSGIQISGLFNYSKGVNGVQIAGLLNKASKMSGLQIGLINIADSIEGVGIGLISFYRYGYHKAGFSYNEINMFNLNYKSGNGKLYSIFNLGINPDDKSRAYSGGFGLGSDVHIFKNKWFFAPELLHQVYYVAHTQNFGQLSRLQCLIKYRPAAQCAIISGPALSMAYSADASVAETIVPKEMYTGSRPFYIGRFPAWLGWTLGMELF